MIDATRSQPRPGQIVAIWSPSHGPDVGQFIRNCMPYWLTSHDERLSDVALWWPVEWPAPMTNQTPAVVDSGARGLQWGGVVDISSKIDYTILTAKVSRYSVRADFSFVGHCAIIFQRPQAVTTGLTLAGGPPSDAWGRTILNPRHFKPPKTSNKKAAGPYRRGF